MTDSVMYGAGLSPSTTQKEELDAKARILRTVFTILDDDLMQFNASAGEVTLSKTDLCWVGTVEERREECRLSPLARDEKEV
jgi:hypothetical protein